jgi:nucleotide-binding universal stress UspA family protein
MSWKTILVPHDFSASANHAAALARDEAKQHGARIVLLHVIDMPHNFQPDMVVVPPETGAPINVREYAMSSAETHIADIAKRLAAEAVAVTTQVRVGSPVDEINKVVAIEKADLVVVGTHGRTGLQHLLLGSVAERIVRTCKVPVLTVRHPDHA